LSTIAEPKGKELEERAKPPQKTEFDHLSEARQRLVAAALPHVVFDGWSEATFAVALADSGVDPALGHLACPRGALDLALANHRQGDRAMLRRIDSGGLAGLRYSKKVAALVRFRLEVAGDREVVRRGVTYFAMPAHAAEGTAAIWQTADEIWKALGDTSDDLNWYSKRAILSAVYTSTLLFWLGDQSENHQQTWEFLDRRIANVMQFEKFKSGLKGNALFKGFMKGPRRIFDKVHAPTGVGRPDLPGYVAPKD
jgi:ubiquinone biosynthesis protein COQ9